MLDPIRALFTDIGGVLLTNGWDRHSRKDAASRFGIDYEELNERHHLTYDTYESGKTSLDTYLDRIAFFKPRPYSKQDFKDFMFAQSKSFPETLSFFKKVKALNHLRVAAVSNEGRELAEYRVTQFDLESLVDFFIVSSFVHFRKPDEDIFKLALDTAQVPPNESVYIDDRALFVEVAGRLGFHSIHHRSLETTQKALGELGLKLP